MPRVPSGHTIFQRLRSPPAKPSTRVAAQLTPSAHGMNCVLPFTTNVSAKQVPLDESCPVQNQKPAFSVKLVLLSPLTGQASANSRGGQLAQAPSSA